MSFDATKFAASKRRIAREWHAPPGDPRTANNLELVAMNYIRVRAASERLHLECDPELLSMPEGEAAVVMMRRDAELSRSDESVRMLEVRSRRFWEMLPDERERQRLDAHLTEWLNNSFSRLEIDHKLAAALCLTDVPGDVEIKAPWAAWSLVLPDGLLVSRYGAEQIARVWCDQANFTGLAVTTSGRLGVVHDDIWWAVRNLIKGACLALSDPDRLRAARRPRGDAATNKRLPPDLVQAQFKLGLPVKIDLRQHLREALDGKAGGSPTVQFLVRGHWRAQAYGPKASLRKTIWVEPFWKGPEDTRVLLRTHQAEAASP